MFAIFVDDRDTRRMVRRGWSRLSVCPMSTLRRIQAVSIRVAPHWCLCVIVGAYFSLQIAVTGPIAG
jgi:hypothetical protein